ncbi:hypothetical protein SASPL_156497 [Salvia splendens]|uniref:Uncharacterized protein n=1 Tax=Salvia splendens TaxID=180675 RepID=A0A8X8YXU4_SALSN|nr:hypothetical protein SASPL_156497 [Salvia splendens]
MTEEMVCAFIDAFAPEMLKTAAFAADDLFVDELLDFSNEFEEMKEEQQQLEEPEEKEQDQSKTASSVLEEKLTPAPENSPVSTNGDFGSLPESELSLPVEGLESLEWLSHFVEDSFSDYSLTGKLPPKPAEKESAAGEQLCFSTPVQPLRRYQDSAVAGRPARVEDSLQCLWGEVQVGPAPAGVPARMQPDVLGRDALKQPPKVLEMRRKKESETEPAARLSLLPIFEDRKGKKISFKD